MCCSGGKSVRFFSSPVGGVLESLCWTCCVELRSLCWADSASGRSLRPSNDGVQPGFSVPGEVGGLCGISVICQFEFFMGLCEQSVLGST